MQRMITIKSVNELPNAFKDMVEFQVTDNNIEAVLIKVGDDAIRIVKSGSYTDYVKVLMTQPKKEVTKYKLSGTVSGMVMVPEIFDSESKALLEKSEYEDKFFSAQCDLKVESFTEFVDEDKI